MRAPDMFEAFFQVQKRYNIENLESLQGINKRNLEHVENAEKFYGESE